MLDSLGKHSLIDLTVQATGDLDVDAHHTVEDTAIALGQALREALGDKAGIRRFGDALGAARRGAVPGRRRRVRTAVRRARRRARGRSTSLIGGHFTGSLTRHISSRSRFNAGSACTSGCSPAATRTTSSRPSSRRWRGRCGDAVALDPRVVGVPATKGAL